MGGGGSAVSKYAIETCFWLRGIVPVEWSQEALNRISHNHTKEEVLVSTNPSGGSPVFSGDIVVYGDASGGKFTSYPALRRVGVGLAAIDSIGNLVWGLSLNLPGQCQTVPRGELFAIFYTVFKSEDNTNIEFITDNLGCYKTYNKGKSLAVLSNNGDLYRKIFNLLEQKNVSLIGNDYRTNTYLAFTEEKLAAIIFLALSY